MMLMLAVAVLYLALRRTREEVTLWIWFAVPVGANILFAAVMKSSALLMGVPPLILLAAHGISKLSDWMIEAGKRFWSTLNPEGWLYRGIACNC